MRGGGALIAAAYDALADMDAPSQRTQPAPHHLGKLALFGGRAIVGQARLARLSPKARGPRELQSRPCMAEATVNAAAACRLGRAAGPSRAR